MNRAGVSHRPVAGNASGMSMSIDLTEPIAAASHGARRAQRLAKRAADETRRSVETRVDRGSRRVRCRAADLTDQSTKPGFRVWGIGAILIGGAGVIAALVMKQQRSRATSSLAPSDGVDLTSTDLNGASRVPNPSHETSFAP